MNMRLLAALALVASASCSSGGGSVEISRPVESAVVDDRPSQKSAGWCDSCHFLVFQGHRCGLTVPCALCQREIGARHLHEVVWRCEVDDLVMAQQHECGDAKSCRICRKDHRTLLGTRGCDHCFRQAPPVRIQGITDYCQECNQEVGANHIHGKTRYCRPCLREAGDDHVCDATRLCMSHEVEHAPDHVHGTTVYCKRCHRDAGEGHKHGETEWCWLCEDEMQWPHAHHD